MASQLVAHSATEWSQWRLHRVDMFLYDIFVSLFNLDNKHPDPPMVIIFMIHCVI